MVKMAHKEPLMVSDFLAGMRATMVQGEIEGIYLSAQEVRGLCDRLSAAARQAAALERAARELDELQGKAGTEARPAQIRTIKRAENVVPFPAGEKRKGC